MGKYFTPGKRSIARVPHSRNTFVYVPSWMPSMASSTSLAEKNVAEGSSCPSEEDSLEDKDGTTESIIDFNKPDSLINTEEAGLGNVTLL